MASAQAYLDDGIVYGQNLEEHCRRFIHVLHALSKAKLKLKPNKCYFAYTEVTYLGHVVSKKNVKPDPVKKKERKSAPSKSIWCLQLPKTFALSYDLYFTS